MGILTCFTDEMATIFIRILSAALHKWVGLCILPHFWPLSGLLFYSAVVDMK